MEIREMSGMRLLPVLLAIALLTVGCAGRRGPGTGPGDRVYLHRVQAGESLADIASDYYGDPERRDVIAKFNDIKESDVQAGAVLRVPMTPEDVERLKGREKASEPYNKGLSLAEEGSYLDAVREFRNAIAIDPGFVDAHYNLGVTYQKLGSNEKALEQFQDVVRLRPDVALYHYALGNAYFHLSRYDEAAEVFKEAIERNGTHAKSLYSLAVCYEKLGRREQAIDTWKRYLEVDGTSVWATEARNRLEELQKD